MWLQSLPAALSPPCLHFWPEGGQKAGRWGQVMGWVSLCLLHDGLDGHTQPIPEALFPASESVLPLGWQKG